LVCDAQAAKDVQERQLNDVACQLYPNKSKRRAAVCISRLAILSQHYTFRYAFRRLVGFNLRSAALRCASTSYWSHWQPGLLDAATNSRFKVANNVQGTSGGSMVAAHGLRPLSKLIQPSMSIIGHDLGQKALIDKARREFPHLVGSITPARRLGAATLVVVFRMRLSRKLRQPVSRSASEVQFFCWLKNASVYEQARMQDWLRNF
jgi:hypothetical protein